MKYLLFALASNLLISACNDSNPENRKDIKIEKPEMPTLQNRIESMEKILRHEDFEKINLLAEYNKIQVDTLISIIRDYLVFTSKSLNADLSKEERYKSSFIKLNQRYKLSKKKLATLIYSYKYEMISREEIEESAIDDYLNSPELYEEINDQNEYY